MPSWTASWPPKGWLSPRSGESLSQGVSADTPFLCLLLPDHPFYSLVSRASACIKGSQTAPLSSYFSAGIDIIPSNIYREISKMTSAGFDWSASVIWEGPGAIVGNEEHLSADRLDRARYAKFLTNYLAAEGKQRNYVLNLNAEWGAGKTWFIKRWYMELKAHYPTVYIDAWQQDFSDDPLLTVISSIIDQLKMIAGKENPIPEGMRQRLLGLFKVGSKLALKAAIKKAGLEEDDFSLEGEDANQLVDALCSNQKERYESIQYLKQEIRQWVEGAVGLSEGELNYPAFILIDELDRCRPSYAIEMLETIKHIFDIPKVVFVLATDTEQLQHAIKVIYGGGFDASTYLRRFFKRRFMLKKVSTSYFIEYSLGFDSAKCNHFFPQFKNAKDLSMNLSMIVDAFDLKLRDIEQYLYKLKAIIINAADKVDLILLSIFIIAEAHNPELYQKMLAVDVKSIGDYFKCSSLLEFNLPCFINLTSNDECVINMSIYDYLRLFFISMQDDMLNAVDDFNSFERIESDSADSILSGLNENEVLLVYCLANQGLKVEEYQDLVELSCWLK
ncbi:KAP family P-loop NTPase fold protein [Aeromonas enteropelogenes]|uniref:KAP family P-loop NTPase fold protein n=1 Tax=Aeromonas enteropelogenes TaxID=29489 RepID=UPI0021AAA168|nr:KAP family NTPase [Aeromonas enteropelogenes]